MSRFSGTGGICLAEMGKELRPDDDAAGNATDSAPLILQK
jgi:hypothetical protein